MRPERELNAAPRRAGTAVAASIDHGDRNIEEQDQPSECLRQQVDPTREFQECVCGPSEK